MADTPDLLRQRDLSSRHADFERDADRLLSLYTGAGAKEVVLNHLRALGLGNPKNKDPALYGAVGRLVSSLNVLRSSPPTRMLRRGREILDPMGPEAVALEDVYERCDLDTVWPEIDAMRILFRSCVVAWAECPEEGKISARIFPPQYCFRDHDPNAADILERDKSIALLLCEGDEPGLRRYQWWRRVEDGGWLCHVVTGAGELVGEQPYGESGVVPFSELPLQLVTDRPLVGRAWLPLPVHRLTASLAADAALNDLLLLVANEAHTQKAVTSPNPKADREAVKEQGPDKVWVLAEGTTASVLAHSPKISESEKVIDRILSGLALSEGLPPDAFSPHRGALTGEALRVSERDADRRRRSSAVMAAHHERQAYRKIASIVEAVGQELDLPKLDRSLSLVVAFSQRWEAASPRELQEVALRDLAIGAKSLPEYVAESRQIGLSEAEALLSKIEEERARWPLGIVGEQMAKASTSPPRQNPAAIVDGPKPAVGPAAASKAPGAFNPKLGTASEGASVVDVLAS